MTAVILGLACFSMMDVVMKSLGLAIGTYNAILWRVMAALLLAATLYFAQRPRKPERRVMKLHIQRGILTIFMAYSFFWGITIVPLAEAIALSFVAPLIALYLAAIFLGEHISRIAILASVLGFSGVLVVAVGRMQYGYSEGVVWGFAAILFSALLYAINLVMQRRQAQLAGPVEISFFQNLIMVCGYGAAAPFAAKIPDMEFVPQIIIGAVLSVLSAMLISWGYARAQAQILVNLEYSAFIWAAIFGWIFFSEEVTVATLLGTMLIVAACLLVARRPAPQSF